MSMLRQRGTRESRVRQQGQGMQRMRESAPPEGGVQVSGQGPASDDCRHGEEGERLH